MCMCVWESILGTGCIAGLLSRTFPVIVLWCIEVPVSRDYVKVDGNPITSIYQLQGPEHLTFFFYEIGIIIVPPHVKQFAQYLKEGKHSMKMLDNIIN